MWLFLGWGMIAVAVIYSAWACWEEPRDLRIIDTQEGLEG